MTGRRAPRGYILLEMAVVYVIIAYAVATFVVTLGLVMKAGPRSEEALVAAALAEGLLEEVQLRKWDETTSALRTGYPTFSPSALGLDAGDTGGSKATFNDVDDFSGWSESPVQDPGGSVVSGLGGYSRSVSVSYVSSATLSVSVSTTDYKLVTVCATKGTTAQACLKWLATNK